MFVAATLMTYSETLTEAGSILTNIQQHDSYTFGPAEFFITQNGGGGRNKGGKIRIKHADSTGEGGVFFFFFFAELLDTASFLVFQYFSICPHSINVPLYIVFPYLNLQTISQENNVYQKERRR